MKNVLLALMCLLLPVSALAADYVIGEGDVVGVSVWGEQDLTTHVKVRPDGKISLPGINDVQAAGLTPDQLRASLTGGLTTLLKDPIVSVSLIDSRNSNVFVVGGGVESRVFHMESRTTLLQLLASLGSLQAADLHAAYVYRDGKKIMTGFYDLFSKGQFEQDIQLEAGDTVYLPLKTEVNVFVVGAVNTPKAIFCREGLTLLDAILEAGSFSKYADENKTVVVRKEGNEKRFIDVKAKDLVNKGDLAQNLPLQAGDYIIVKESYF